MHSRLSLFLIDLLAGYVIAIPYSIQFCAVLFHAMPCIDFVWFTFRDQFEYMLRMKGTQYRSGHKSFC